jgi:outer membrane lipoprotein-sorting protein
MRTSMFSAAVLAAIFVAGPVRADDDAKKIIQDAVKALGGADVLAKHFGKGIVQNGKIHVSAGGMDLDGTMEVSTQGGKFQRKIKISVMGTDVAQTTVFNGETLWIATNGTISNTIDKKEDVALIKESIYGDEALNRVLRGDAGFKLSIIGDDKVDDNPVVGVRISSEGHKDISVYFDKKTHLVRKVVGRGLDVQSQMEVESERILDNYKEVDGQMRPMHAIVNQDGKKLIEIEFTDAKYVEKLDDGAFAKPKEGADGENP